MYLVSNTNYTVIELSNVTKLPKTKNLSKVKLHLTSIFREFIRKDILILRVDKEVLKFIAPKILYAARKLAEAILNKDPDLQNPHNTLLKSQLALIEEVRNLGKIS